MNLLYKILYAAHASGTHHKIALRALAEIKAPEAERWRRVFLAHAVDFMEGAKAPDKDFKDFQNHVLHPGHGHGPDWGGAAEAAEDWYANTVDALRRGAFADAAYSAGVLSHYYSDVWMPLHTASSEEETVIHRALDWSASRAFEQLWAERPRVEVVIEPTPDWLTRMVRHAAYSSNASYDALIQGYDFDVGAKRPAEGLTRPARLICARMLSAAVAGVARIYDRALAEAGGAPPNVDLTVSTALAGLGAPISRVLAKIEDLGARAEVARIHRELRVTGRVESALPLEQRIVRGLSPRRRFGPDAAELGPTVAPPSAADAAPRRDPAAGRASGLARAAQGADALIREPAFEKTALDHALQRAIIATPVSAAAERAAPPATLRADPADAPRAAAARPAPSEAGPRPEATPAPAAASAPAKPPAPRPSAPTASVTRPDAGLRGSNDDRRAATPRLAADTPIVRAPSIGPRTAERLAPLGVETVGDLLDADPTELAAQLDDSRLPASVVATWRDQAALLTRVPRLTNAQAVMLVACGYRDVGAVAAADADRLAEELEAASRTREIRRALRKPTAPEPSAVRETIARARRAIQAA